MANGRTETIKGFKSKSGKRFNACLVLKKEPVTEGSEKMHTVVAFDFDNVEDENHKGCCLSALWWSDKKDIVWLWMCELQG